MTTPYDGPKQPTGTSDPTKGGMSLMGHPLPPWRRRRAYAHARALGLDSEPAEEAVSKIAERYERDDPFGAQQMSLGYVDLTGHYRLMSALLADPDTESEWAVACRENDPVANRAPEWIKGKVAAQEAMDELTGPGDGTNGQDREGYT